MNGKPNTNLRGHHIEPIRKSMGFHENRIGNQWKPKWKPQDISYRIHGTPNANLRGYHTESIRKPMDFHRTYSRESMEALIETLGHMNPWKT